jgi:hypothetical protein
LPAVRQADQSTLIIADGFSCREQILQSTDRHALHLAEVIQLAMHQEEVRELDDRPEDQHHQLQPPDLRAHGTSAAVASAVAALIATGAGAAYWWLF